MKAMIEKEEVYTLKVGAVILAGLRVTSRWKGLTELTDEKKQTLIVMGLEDSPLTRAMSRILMPHQPDSVEVSIVSASPDILGKLLVKEKADE